jgi:rapamycin-insensitive companion of mTOR
MQILEAHHFRLPACRFVLDLFDKRVLQQIVLEEEEDNQGEVNSSESESDSDMEQSGTNGAALTLM